MKRLSYFILSLTILVFWSSCRKDFEFSASTGSLEFSKDTVYLDTVFTNIGSSTYNLKVYNNSNDDIIIPSIKLSEGYNSYYRMTIDGTTGLEGGSNQAIGKVFENIEMLAKDSMYIFIETTIDIQDLAASQTQFLYTDAIEFDSGDNLQKVELVTLVKDANFIYPQRFLNSEGEYITETLTFDVDGDGMEDETTIEGRFLDDSELTFTNEKSYVIYGYAAVADGKTLTVESGARVHFHANSGLLITDGASLKVNGVPSLDQELMEGEVIFEGDRLEPAFADIPGQWQTIWLFNNSVDNVINHATIKNGTIGVLSDGNQDDPTKFTLTNSQIYNSSNFGILGRGTSIYGENVVVNNSGQSSFAGTYGGSYNFVHTTFANYWNNSFRQFPSVLLNNFIIDEDNTVFTNPLDEANFTNCIVYGNDNPELILDRDPADDFNFKFTNSLIKFDNSNNNFTGDLYDFNNSLLYENVIFNQDPGFLDPNNNKLKIPNGSPVDNFGIVFGNLSTDILNTTRSVTPDLGAYESVEFEDN
ncbi:hypothetical protein MWU58_07960 [Flavobacteriaceae bacterium S0825]|uniref:hypothetical protein n=1 Tax=Gaetbulibacter sp. S0825 TaxID=2720084 RepID=UPI00143093D8|nr:hypothetical protein [Gaetbulibacter sp. S0825]MCK0109224.1 hypothetical protein [Flavobacteriaceae bacterium S0825]NIX64859.1 hypothetical protein [Gaetbulibacter sp. S0825]